MTQNGESKIKVPVKGLVMGSRYYSPCRISARHLNWRYRSLQTERTEMRVLKGACKEELGPHSPHPCLNTKPVQT